MSALELAPEPRREQEDAPPPVASALPTALAGLVQAPPLDPPSLRREKLQSSIPDPWAALSDDQAFDKVQGEAWDQVLSLPEDFKASPGPAHVLVGDACFTGIESKEGLAGAAISMDFSGNSLEKVEALPALWLRSLVLASNPLRSLHGLGELFPKLLAVDLSFVDIPSVAGAWPALAKCVTLRSLVAEGSGLSSMEDLEPMMALENLELMENEIEDLENIQVLAGRCPALRRLDFRENPIATEPGYARAIKQHLPKLVWHNNQSLKRYIAKGVDKVGYENLNAESFMVDGLYKNESCSCLEGNPCADPTNCIDWENREAVAAEARKRKGLRDDSGKQL